MPQGRPKLAQDGEEFRLVESGWPTAARTSAVPTDAVPADRGRTR